MTEILSFTCRMSEYEQIEASDRHCLLYAYLKNFYDIKISSNKSTVVVIIIKESAINTYQDSG